MDLKNLTDKETELIIAALHAVAPSGRGSTALRLAIKLQQETGIVPTDALVCNFQLNTYKEIRDNCLDADLAYNADMLATRH